MASERNPFDEIFKVRTWRQGIFGLFASNRRLIIGFSFVLFFAAISLALIRFETSWTVAFLILLCAVVVVGFLALMAARGDIKEAKASIEAMATSDAPAQTAEDDRLQFTLLAKGLSRFLRNVATRPPLTVAISGEWGSGKSTLMHLLCEDLKKYGCRPIWFNAWHHQSEEQLLAALFSAIRDQVLPSWLSLEGIVFRIKLIFKRSTKRYLLAFLTFGLMAGALSFVLSHQAEDWQKMGNFLVQLVEEDGAKSKAATTTEAISTLGALTALLMGMGAVYKKVKAFGADPAVLLGTVSDAFDLKDAQAMTNFRAKFASQFHDVAEALDAPIVIVIDDLDRCKAEAVLNVMEGVNFLTSSGECFVIFGMATDRVCAALSMSFEKIALEMIDVVGHPNANIDAEPVQEARRRYAKDYLEKLINIVIQVPAREDLPAHALLTTVEQSSMNRWKSLYKSVSKLAPVIGIIAAILIGGYAGWKATMPMVTTASTSADAPSRNNTDKKLEQIDATKVVGQSSASPGNNMSSTVGRKPFVSLEAISLGGKFLIAIGSILAIATGAIIYQDRRRQIRQVADSPNFLKALEVWAPIVRNHRKTPRAIKRFGNRIRYLAMLQQREGVDSSAISQVRMQIADWWKSRSPASRGAARDPDQDPGEHYGSLEDHRIVALGALYEILGPQWIRVFEVNASDPFGPSEYEEKFAEVIQQYQEKTDASWPPSEEEITAFQRALNGVRLPGDPRPIDGTARTRKRPTPKPSQRFSSYDSEDGADIQG